MSNILSRLGMNAVATWDVNAKWVARKAISVLKTNEKMVLARAHGALRVFESATQNGTLKVLHHPSAHHVVVKQLLEVEEALYPNVCSSTFDRYFYAPSRLERFEKEFELADAILCPSRFAAESVSKNIGSSQLVKVIPYGDTVLSAEFSYPIKKESVFLIAGNLTARKGVHRVLRVWKKLKAYKTHQLRLIGDMHLNPVFLREFSGSYEHLEKIPRHDLFHHYARSQALIINAMAEGFANVIPEAMGCGTPVLASRNSGADGFVTHGSDAILYDYGDDDALSASLEWALSHPDELGAMGINAKKCAAAWSWQHFKEELTTWLSGMLAGKIE
ncbi:MAG: glycosyltransferase family 4 protein [Nitrospira sp.]